MAFVFETERKVNEINKLMSPLGPGQYHNIETQHKLHDSAPFHSTSLRKTLFEPKGIEKPGPGDYQISKPIVEPNIKSVSNSHSIILKINSTGTAQFKSTNQRFRDNQTEVPGPGQYAFDLNLNKRQKNRSRSGSIVENAAIKKIKEMNKTFQTKNIPTIPQRTRGLTDSKKQVEIADEEKIGPAFYNPSKTVHVNSTGAVWGKDITKRFVMDRKNALGPGQYKADYKPSRPDDKANLSSGHFRSATVRTYFDSLIYKTNVDATAEDRKKIIFKTKDPAPGQYDYNTSSFAIKEKPFSFQFFGSTVQRFTQEESLSEKPRKNAFYNLHSKIGQNQSFNRGNHPFNAETERDASFLSVKQRVHIPGPGQYQEKVVVEKKLKGVNVQKFGSTTDRPFHKKDEINQIGPGKYQKSENVQQFIKNRFGQIKNETFHFKSTTERKCFGDITSETKFGEYDVSYNDVAKKLERQKMFLENLKKIDVDKAPFESTNSRFPHYENKVSPMKEKQKKMNMNKEQEMKIKQEAERARSMLIETNRSQLYENKERGVLPKTERFPSERRGVPGSGTYSVKQQWQKRSYNVKFQRK